MIGSSEFPHLQLSHITDKLFLKIFAIVDLALVQVQHEEQEHGHSIAFGFEVLDHVDVEEDVPVYLSEAEEDGEDLEVVVVFNVPVCYLITLLTL